MSTMTMGQAVDYPLGQTRAAKMLAEAFERLRDTKGWSQRQIAAWLGYKNSVPLSHMTTGRIPVPLDRVGDFSRILGLDQGELFLAAFEQRYPDIDIAKIIAKEGGKPRKKAEASQMASELEDIARRPLDDLPMNVVNVLRAAVADASPERRWIAPEEAQIFERLRKKFPQGITPRKMQALLAAIDTLD